MSCPRRYKEKAPKSSRYINPPFQSKAPRHQCRANVCVGVWVGSEGFGCVRLVCGRGWSADKGGREGPRAGHAHWGGGGLVLGIFCLADHGTTPRENFLVGRKHLNFFFNLNCLAPTGPPNLPKLYVPHFLGQHAKRVTHVNSLDGDLGARESPPQEDHFMCSSRAPCFLS